MLVYADTNARDALAAKPPLDREATAKLVAPLFPDEKLEPIEDGNLSCTNPPDDEIFAGCVPGMSAVAAEEFGIDHLINEGLGCSSD